MATWTRPQRLSDQCLETIAVVARGIDRRFGRCHPEEFAASGELLRAMAIAEEAEVPDAVKSVRQHMDQEAADELLGREGHRLPAAVVPVILPAEAEFAVIHGQQAVVGDGDAMGIAPYVVEDLSRPGERPLGIDHPLCLPGRRQVAPERRRLMQVTMFGEEVQLAGGKGLLEVPQEQTPKHPRQHPHRQKEPRPAGDPALPVWRDAAAGNQEMNVRMVRQVLCPGVQHAEEADLHAEMLGIGGDDAQGLRCRTEQDIVDHRLVLERDDLDLRRYGEHDVEVRHVEQLRLAILQPLGAREILTLWAVAISARVVRDTLMAAVTAALDVTAESGGAATLDR